MGLFGAGHGCVGGGERQKGPRPKICHTYPEMMKLGTVILHLKKIQKMYHVAHPLSSADISIFTEKRQIFCYQEIQIQIAF